VSERSPNQTGEQVVWQGSPSQAVNLPVYLLMGLGLIVATVGLSESETNHIARMGFPDYRGARAIEVSFAGDLVGPIYTGGGLESATEQTLARRDQALAAYELTVQNAFRDTEDALVSLQTAGEVEQTQLRRVFALEDAVRLARLRYDNGYSDTLDLLDSERGLLSAQLSHTAARADRYRALVSLYRALGGDWVDEAEIEADAPATEAGELP